MQLLAAEYPQGQYNGGVCDVRDQLRDGEDRKRIRGNRSGTGGVPADLTALGDQAAIHLNERAS